MGLSRGNRADKDRLFALLHSDIHAQASAYLSGERAGHTLQATALVNEAWMRLIDQERVEVSSKNHFMALAAQAMRRVLVDHARARNREKRGGGQRALELDTGLLAASEDERLDLVAVNAALTRLQDQSPRLASMVELRFFGGMTIEDVAAFQEVGRATVVRDWRVARALLSRFLNELNPNEG
jgi:RNA polymerase sigma factor (TIGR02999 family)